MTNQAKIRNLEAQLDAMTSKAKLAGKVALRAKIRTLEAAI